MAFGEFATGFNYWEIVPGQGDYYNPRFITMQNDTIEKQGYLTNLITDMSIDWMENQRDKDKPFCILIHHKGDSPQLVARVEVSE